ncbi:MAG: TIGR01777 family oxidoreductase [Bacteroidota bacterium]|nr:TIGR01777 family oxidoreductase [Bacteroidota bacterium]
MQVSICGSSGFIGKALFRECLKKGWTINRINRESFNMTDEEFIEKKIEGSDVVINLAGASLSKKWTREWKMEIRDSRILTTRRLVASIAKAVKKPSLFIQASAVGIYDHEGMHTEDSTRFGTDFLAQVCQDWEKEALIAENTTRLVIFRQGVVLGPNGGIIENMKSYFRYGLGGRIGNGDQYMSFIHIDDLMEAFMFAIDHPEMSGIYNAVTPYPSTNREFTMKFGRVVNQPAGFTVPAFAARLFLGERASLLLDNIQVYPDRLKKAGFTWKYPTVQNALVATFR